MPDAEVDAIEASKPGWLARQLEKVSSGTIDTKLRKRYAVPFSAPYHNKVIEWLDAIVTLRAYMRQGFNAQSEQDSEIVKASERALAELDHAADAEKGLFDLPLRQNTTASGIVAPVALFYSEAGPYTWITRQREAIDRGE
jgi:hypothetical protein